MAYDGSLKAPMPQMQGTFNDISGSLKAPMPVMSGTFNITWGGALVAPMPIISGLINLVWHGALIAPMPVMSGDFSPATIFTGTLKAPMPVMRGQVGQAWYGNLAAPFPKIQGIFVGSQYNFSGELKAPMPVITGYFIGSSGASYSAVLVMNLKNRGISEYENYDYNSACYFNGKYLGMKKGGIYNLDGTDDAGTNIDAVINLGSYDFGSQNENIIPDIYLKYSGDDTLQVYMAVDQSLEITDSDVEIDGPFYSCPPEENKMQTIRIELPKGISASRHQFQITNSNGAYFHLKDIGIPIERLQRRRS